MKKPLIIVCDDEPVARRGAVRALGTEAHDFVECGDGRACLEVLGRPRHGVDLVLLDLRMPGMDGMTTLAHLTALSSPPPVVVVTADSTLRTAIDAVKAGAVDYLSKPYEIDELRFVVEKTLESARLAAENRRLKEEVKRLGGSRALLGESPAMRQALDAVERVAPASASVLIRGESGTGKELVARRDPRPLASAPGARSWPSTARPSPTRWWRASSSATGAAPSPGRTATVRASSGRRTAAPCSWTRSATWRSRPRPSSSASSRRGRSSPSAAASPCRSTSASWPPPTGT